ncbi:MAG: hypothetical protein ACM3XM_07465 [Mycobacterium leprae]
MHTEPFGQPSGASEQLPQMLEHPCHEGHHHDVVCIEAKKVFDFCFQEHHVEREFPDLVPHDLKHVRVECEIEESEILCREVGKRRPVEGKPGKFIVCVAVEVPIRIKVIDEYDERICRTIHQKVVFLKQAVLCAPEGTDVECQVTGNCCCFFDRHHHIVTCAFDFCVVLETKAKVKLLVPSMGLCLPAQCKSVPACPPRVPHDCARDC